mmetsp:Transcript_42363/g.70457  ORF Transcript_42363/g.70457 Transcript_42363/m.70457 type:complete len:170 (+) Transcript_42363:41-550(+)
MLYDSGMNPSKMPKANAGAGALRRELAHLLSQQNVVGSAAPRRIRLTLPMLDANGVVQAKQPKCEEESMPALERLNQLSAKDNLFLTNVEPHLNQATARHSLNFNGRVTVGSVKNMQLYETTKPNVILCQFGKVGNDEFTLDFTWPLTPLQAFAVGISSLAYKLANEGG